jgi:hypothetical protein
MSNSLRKLFVFAILAFSAHSAFGQQVANPITSNAAGAGTYGVQISTSDAVQLTFSSVPPGTQAIYGTGNCPGVMPIPQSGITFNGPCTILVQSTPRCGGNLMNAQATTPQMTIPGTYSFNGSDSKTIIVSLPNNSGTGGLHGSMMH